MKINTLHTFSCLQRTRLDYLENDHLGVSRGIVFQEIRPGAGFRTGDVVIEKLGGGYLP